MTDEFEDIPFFDDAEAERKRGNRLIPFPACRTSQR